MDYHARNRSEDDVIRIPADGYAFRDMEEKWIEFKEEPHNIMISLGVDGVNPFAQMESIYLVCPIFVINNNIPPLLSIKREHIMLSMIIPCILCLQLFYFECSCGVPFVILCFLISYIYFLFYSCACFIYLNGSHNDIFYMYFKSIR